MVESFGMALYTVQVSCAYIGGLAVPKLCRLLALCQAWFRFDPRHFHMTAKCYAGLSNSDSNLIIKVHCSRQSASKIDEFINNLQSKNIVHSLWWLAHCRAFRVLPGTPQSFLCWFWDHSYQRLVKLDPWPLASSSLLRHSLPCHGIEKRI